MTDISTAKMASQSFDPQDLVRELTSKASVSIDGLLVARKQVQSLADDTNSQLKKNVYKNYSLFIETAKEISYLKNEMFQLSHLLTDQQNLMASLLDISIGGQRPALTAIEKKEALDRVVKEHKEKVINSTVNTVSKELSTLLDRIEGSAGILETRTRASVLFSGELMELDSNEYKIIQPIFAILLNDGLIVSSILPPNASRNQKKYKFQSIYDLDNIAVVNVKDPNLETAFKILMFPTTKVFRTDSKQTKIQWLDAFEAAKKQRKASLTLQRRDSLMYISNMSIDGTASGVKTPISPIDRPYASILNPFEEAELLEEVNESDTELVPQWLTELPEDLDVCIAQRNFEDAVSLVLRVNEHFQMYPKCCDNIMQTDLKLRVEHRIKELIDALTHDLQIAPDRSLQTGPRSSRRSVRLLLKLGKSSLATKLFLNQRSALLKFCLKQQKIDGATLQYIKRMSSVFFNNVIETTKEFQKAFDLSIQTNGGLVATPPTSLINDNLCVNGDKLSPTQSQSIALSMACLVSWARNQLNHFIGLFSRHVFTTQVSPSIAAECVAIIRYQCSKMKTSIGMDFLFYLDKHLKTDIERIITEIKDKLLEAIKLRAAEDKWVPQNFHNKMKISKFLEDMKDIGITSFDKYIVDEYCVNLTSNSTTFAKSYFNSLKDLLKLTNSVTKKLVIEALIVTFKAQMKHIATSLKSPLFKSEHMFIEKNAAFLLDVVLTLNENYYCDKIQINSCEELARMHSDYAYLKGGIEPKPRARSKTSSPIKTAYTSTTYL
ncbi:exocyst complex component 8-like [Oppia nitens]|uniref:exocyst complex component 8-like n=1 Tax=Oppia nitens TaxID=1686743 RepID=UPI0023DC2C5C|nr:exocyst complex component 8-like [Oppia nitens]